MNPLKYYGTIYLEYLRTNLSQATSFRTHFVLLVLVDIFFYLSALASVDFIYDHVQSIGHWNKDQFMFFIGFVLAVDHLHMTCISENFWNFSHEVITGKFDFILLKPASAIFITFFRFIRIPSALNALLPWGALIYFGTKLSLSFWDWLALPFLVLLALTLLVSFEILLSLATFLTLEAYGINFLRMQFQQISRWPDFVFQFKLRKLFTFVIPVLLVGSAPTRFLFDSADHNLLICAILITFLLWAIIHFFWRLGLLRYESASS